MTFKEKLQKEHPDCVHKRYCGGASGCPIDYNYENESLCVGRLGPSREKCTKCWDREMPTTLDAEKKKMTIDEAIKHCHEVAAGALCEGTVNHKACGEEHKQLAEWLVELKELKEYKRKTALYLTKMQKQNVIDLEDDSPECPNCGDDLDKWDEYSYCPNCGQALSWDYPEEDTPEEE